MVDFKDKEVNSKYKPVAKTDRKISIDGWEGYLSRVKMKTADELFKRGIRVLELREAEKPVVKPADKK